MEVYINPEKDKWQQLLQRPVFEIPVGVVDVVGKAPAAITRVPAAQGELHGQGSA